MLSGGHVDGVRVAGDDGGVHRLLSGFREPSRFRPSGEFGVFVGSRELPRRVGPLPGLAPTKTESELVRERVVPPVAVAVDEGMTVQIG